MVPKNDNTLIHAQGLSKIYQKGIVDVIGLDDIDLKIAEGEFIILKGNSGSGKSTLLSLLGGLDKPSRGQLTISGYNLNTANEKTITRYRRSIVGIIFQAFNLLPTLSVLENICLPALLAEKRKDQIISRAEELLEWLQMSNRKKHYPSQLSGGEMQRTAIARALINDPAIILADEPTGNLDSRNGENVIQLLVEMNRKMLRTLIVATHSTMADPFADRQLCLIDGRITQETCSAY